MSTLPNNLISYGPDENCTLSLCPITSSVYQYRPSLPANITLLSLFALAAIIHTILSLRSREWTFLACILLGCIAEMIGYAGRILLWINPFGFAAFLMQICCITVGPVFYCAAIYIQLARTVRALGIEYSRFNPKFFYYGFLSCDVVSLALQGAGGGLSSSEDGGGSIANGLALAGLSFQIATLVVFIGLCVDYAIRWRKADREVELEGRFKVFLGGLSAAMLLIFIRCVYRIDELSQGYSGPLIHNEGLFIGLEGVMIILSVLCLAVAHPGFAFARQELVRPGKKNSVSSVVDEEKVIGLKHVEGNA